MKKLVSMAVAALSVFAANAEVLWEGNVSTGSWGSEEGVSCVKIGKASFATASVGDRLEVTISEVGAEAKLLYKDGSSWADLVDAPAVEPTAPTTAKLTLEETSLAVLKANGLILQGNNVTVTQVGLISNTSIEYKEVWTGNQQITWDGEAAPRVTDAACADLKAGDVIAVTLSAIGDKNNWPKCCFRSVKDDSDITTLELWDFASDAMPIVKSVVIEDPEVWAYGFYVVGCDCTITKMELGFKTSTGETGETILWEGDPTLVSWGAAGPEVSANKGGKIKAGDVMAITVSSLDAAEEWPKIVCRCADGWAEIFNVELWNDRDANATFPLVKNVTITEEMLPMLAKGFNFGGSGASITKVALADTQTSISEISAAAAERAGVYSINGVYMGNSLNGLARGIYVVNGKKVLVK